jgi:hypothetical protein
VLFKKNQKERGLKMGLFRLYSKTSIITATTMSSEEGKNKKEVSPVVKLSLQKAKASAAK